MWASFTHLPSAACGEPQVPFRRRICHDNQRLGGRFLEIPDVCYPPECHAIEIFAADSGHSHALARRVRAGTGLSPASAGKRRLSAARGAATLSGAAAISGTATISSAAGAATATAAAAAARSAWRAIAAAAAASVRAAEYETQSAAQSPRCRRAAARGAEVESESQTGRARASG